MSEGRCTAQLDRELVAWLAYLHPGVEDLAAGLAQLLKSESQSEGV